MIEKDIFLEELYRLRCSCTEQLSKARREERQELAREVEEQLQLIDHMIAERSG